MEEIKIRPFHFRDLEAVTQIARHSFADEMVAQGLTEERFVQLVKTVTRGRMIPFKLLSKLTGTKMGFFVAEINGRIVGFAAYQGQQKIELSNLMVAPDVRRRGVGQALLKARLNALKVKGIPHVTTTILATNHASLGNVKKQGFKLFDQYVILERPLPVPLHEMAPGLISRPLKRSDTSVFQTLEVTTTSPERYNIDGSRLSQYFPPPHQLLLDLLTGTKRQILYYKLNAQPIGFIFALTSKQQGKGVVARPLIFNDHLHRLPHLLHPISTWLTNLNKHHIQIALPSQNQQAITQLQQSGWTQTQSWLRWVKHLNEKH